MTKIFLPETFLEQQTQLQLCKPYQARTRVQSHTLWERRALKQCSSGPLNRTCALQVSFSIASCLSCRSNCSTACMLQWNQLFPRMLRHYPSRWKRFQILRIITLDAGQLPSKRWTQKGFKLLLFYVCLYPAFLHDWDPKWFFPAISSLYPHNNKLER